MRIRTAKLKKEKTERTSIFLELFFHLHSRLPIVVKYRDELPSLFFFIKLAIGILVRLFPYMMYPGRFSGPR